MSMSAIVMMVVSMLVVWGGLALAIALLIRSDHSTPGPEAGSGSGHPHRDL